MNNYMMAVIPERTPLNLNVTDKYLHILLRIIVYSSAIYFFSFITADTDLWGHIKFGKDIWISKALNRFDIYSYTAYGREWINHEWLSELVMYLVYNLFGSPGLLFGKLLIGIVIVHILSSISFNRISYPLVYGPVFVLAVFIMSPGFMIRPQISTFLFTSLYIFVFHQYLERRKDLLWSLPFIMILWVNCHGGFLIGLGMFPIIVVIELIASCLKDRDKRYLHRLIFWCILTEASVLINPYGYRLLVFLYETLSVKRNIWEWNPVHVFDLSYIRFKLFAILVILTLFFQKNRNRYWEMGIILIAMIYALKHQRHTPIFAIVAAPYLTEKLSILGRQCNLFYRIRSFHTYLILVVALTILISYQVFHTANKHIKTGFNILVDPRMYPVYPVHFLKENGIKGNILLPFEWGEYVIWKLYPDCKVSIDGRFRTVYPQEVIDAHFGVLRDDLKYEELLDRYSTDIILAKRNPFFHRLISKQKKWIYIYSDSESIIFIKNKDSYKDIVERLKRKELIYPRKELSIYFH